ncbi:protein phosphatase 1 regulatory subunit 3A [Hoplias malabaricus]|uniref:protein phosphatase 1 regulatory subunit 3A n=1 Tax=Hoplias malabaricus TaxID=27720 RepID=UPI0034617B9C
MAQENKFLTIPTQEGLFAAVRKERSAEIGEGKENEDEEEDEEEEEVRFIPRCSPVPRKRGHSLADETAEYMRIRFALLHRRRVSFADASGGDLVDVRQFVPFDSDDEENDGRWQEEEAKYRKAYREPLYSVRTDFEVLPEDELLNSVRTNKVEVEALRPVSSDPLSFDGFVRVLNLCFHKNVYVRSTMDGWLSHFDYPAEYECGSSDGGTDTFRVRLSFAEPYLFDGARIDFVVRYETSCGEFWANNQGKNYTVILQVSYEEETSQGIKVDDVEVRGILKPARYRTENDYDNDLPQDKEEGDVAGAARERVADLEAPSALCPLVIQPEIDIEVDETLPVSPHYTIADPAPAESTLPSVEDSSDKHILQASRAIQPLTDHLQTAGQSTESPLSTENLISSADQVEVSENHPSSDFSRYPVIDTVLAEADIDVSAESNKLFSPNEDDSQSEISSEVPFYSTITSLTMSPNLQNVGKAELEELEKEEGLEEMKPEIPEIETPMQDQAIGQIKFHEVKNSLHVLRESVWPCSFNETNTDSANQDEVDLSLHLLQGAKVSVTEMQTAKYIATVTSETCDIKEAGLQVESAQADGTWHFYGLTHLEPTGEAIVTQSLPTTSESEIFVHHHQRHGQPLEKEKLSALLSVDAGPPCVSEGAAHKDGPVMTSMCRDDTYTDFTPIVKAVLSQDKTTDPCSSEEEPVTSKEFKMLHDAPAPFQNQGLESQLSLPNRTLEVSSAQSEVVLDQTLIPSIAAFCAAVCLVVGFQEPSLFLVMGLFLVSLFF